MAMSSSIAVLVTVVIPVADEESRYVRDSKGSDVAGVN